MDFFVNLAKFFRATFLKNACEYLLVNISWNFQKFRTYFTPFSNVSIVDFEQLNVISDNCLTGKHLHKSYK